MYKLFLISISFLLLFSCSDEVQKPEGVLSKEKMIKLLKELHLAEAYVNSNYNYSDSSKYMYKTLEDSILKSLNVKEAEFDSSLKYYQKNIKLMDQIYAAAIDSLNVQESVLKQENLKGAQ